MTALRSLRSRLILGWIVWTAGLLPIVHFVTLVLVRRYPEIEMRRFVHYAALSVGALGFMAAGLWHVRKALSPFGRLRERLSAVREGKNRRLEGSYATEVEPLVNDLNALLDHRDEAVERAIAKAGDLAHGLKTPLAVLSQEAERAEAAGHHELAATLSQQVERMRRQIDYHLAQARAAASGATRGARCSVKESAEGLARTLLRLHAPRGLTIDVNVSPEHSVRAPREDLDEMLGNLLDNACKWAKTRVELQASEDDSRVVITVDDDGPGLPPGMREAVLQRGVRADERAPGSGLGLAIVRDLAELYGGAISLGSSPSGGLRARLQLCRQGPSDCVPSPTH